MWAVGADSLGLADDFAGELAGPEGESVGVFGAFGEVSGEECAGAVVEVLAAAVGLEDGEGLGVDAVLEGGADVGGQSAADDEFGECFGPVFGAGAGVEGVECGCVLVHGGCWGEAAVGEFGGELVMCVVALACEFGEVEA